MSALHCRSCGSEIRPEVFECPQCGIDNPFLCSVCKQPTSALTRDCEVYIQLVDDKPLCMEHAWKYCHVCRLPHSMDELTQRIVGWHEVEIKTPQGMRRGPMTKELGMVCTVCDEKFKEPKKPRSGLVKAFAKLLKI